MITAHQLQYSVQLLYHHLADPLGDLQAHIGLDHHLLDDNHQPQIALLASSASIELVSSSARVTSAKFHKGLVGREVQRPGPIDRTPETPGSGKKNRVGGGPFCSILGPAERQCVPSMSMSMVFITNQEIGHFVVDIVAADAPVG